MATGGWYSASAQNQGPAPGGGAGSQPKYGSVSAMEGNTYGAGGGVQAGNVAGWNTVANRQGQASAANPFGLSYQNFAPQVINAPGAATVPQTNFMQQTQYSNLPNIMGGPESLLNQQFWDQINQGMMWEAGMGDLQEGRLRRDTDLGLRGLGLQGQGIDIERGLTKTQIGNLGRLRAILGKQYGLVGEQFANQLMGFQIDEDKARDLAKRGQWDLRSDLTQRGAFNTVANERGTGRINRDLDYALRGIDVGRAGADISRRNSLLGLDEKGIGYDNQLASLNANLATLGLDAQALGLKEEQLNNALADGIEDIGLAGMTSINALVDAAVNGTPEQSQMAQTILIAIFEQAGIPFPTGGAVAGGQAGSPTQMPAATYKPMPGTPG